jgi:hypothetical protein
MKYLGLLLVPLTAFGAAVIFQGDFVKTLKDDFKLRDTARIITESDDPTSVAKEGEAGSLLLRSNGSVYVKTDSGSSTNWSQLEDVSTVSEIDQNVDDLVTLSGESENSTAHSAFTGTVLNSVTTTRSALQALGTQVDTNVSDISTNTSDISTNASDIATNASDISSINDELVYDGADNVFLADEIPSGLTSGANNIWIDQDGVNGALTSGARNIVLGKDAAGVQSTTNDGVFIGFEAGANTASAGGVYIGSGAGSNQTHTGTANVFIGYQAGHQNRGQNNTFIGYQAGRNSNSTSHDSSVHVGAFSGQGMNGGGNISIGAFAGYYTNTTETKDNEFLLGNNDCDYDITSTPCAIEGNLATGDFQFQNSVGVRGDADIRFYEPYATGDNYLAFSAPSAVTSNVTWELPDGDGSDGQVLETDGSGNLDWTDRVSAPAITVYTSGSGTYNVPAGTSYLRVRMVGGGGGGGGSGVSGPTTGTGGGTTTFGSSLLTATGGGPGILSSGGNTGSGGSATVNSPAISIKAFAGGHGGGGGYDGTTANVGLTGGMGGVSALGGAGTSNSYGAVGGAAVANSGSGGAGASTSTATALVYAGTGGGAGAYIEAIIPNPSSSYSYAVGGAGAAGSAGVSGHGGGAGGAGIIIIEAY